MAKDCEELNIRDKSVSTMRIILQDTETKIFASMIIALRWYQSLVGRTKAAALDGNHKRSEVKGLRVAMLDASQGS